MSSFKFRGNVNLCDLNIIPTTPYAAPGLAGMSPGLPVKRHKFDIVEVSGHNFYPAATFELIRDFSQKIFLMKRMIFQLSRKVYRMCPLPVNPPAQLQKTQPSLKNAKWAER